MKFGWINIFGAIIVIIMLIPNIIYAAQNNDEKNLCTNSFMNLIEQIGRYACIILMWLPIFVWEFGFKSVFEMIAYLVINSVLLIVYCVIFAIYIKKKTARRAIILAVIPSCIFLLSGLLLRHWLLFAFAILFSIGHIYVTQNNARH